MRNILRLGTDIGVLVFDVRRRAGGAVRCCIGFTTRGGDYVRTESRTVEKPCGNGDDDERTRRTMAVRSTEEQKPDTFGDLFAHERRVRTRHSYATMDRVKKRSSRS